MSKLMAQSRSLTPWGHNTQSYTCWSCASNKTKRPVKLSQTCYLPTAIYLKTVTYTYKQITHIKCTFIHAYTHKIYLHTYIKIITKRSSVRVQFNFSKVICGNNCKRDLKCWPPWLGNKENFSLKISPKTARKRHFFLFFFILLVNTWFSKKNYIKELIKNSFENIRNQVRQNSTYIQKRIISATIKLHKSNFYLHKQ